MPIVVELEETAERTSPSRAPKANLIHENDVLDTGDGIPAGVLGKSDDPSSTTDYRPERASTADPAGR
jgi:hypothetical protein